MSDSCVWNNTLCEQLGVVPMLIDHISQRDITYSSGLDQTFLPGVSVNAMGDNWEEWMKTCLAVGFKAFYLDFTWDETDWNLCPGSNNTCASLSDISTVLSAYIAQTDTNLGVDFLKVSLRFKTPSVKSSDVSRISDSNLTSAISPVQARILTPNTVIANQQSSSVTYVATNRQNRYTLWPSLEYTLLTTKARLIITVDTLMLPSNISFTPLQGYAFNPLYNVSQLARINWPLEALNVTSVDADLNSLANDPLRALSVNNDDNVVSQWQAALRSGYSPVLNGSISYNTLYNLGNYYQWPWAINEPRMETQKDREELLSNQNYSMCAAQTTNGWIVENCHTAGHILCQNLSDAFDWALVPDYNPFTATTEDSCPEGFYFSAPVSHVETIAAIRALGNYNASWAWTPVNSLSLENCWVDGINTLCSYNIVQGDRNYVALLAVTSTIAFVLVLLMVFLEYRHLKMPLRPIKQKKLKR